MAAARSCFAITRAVGSSKGDKVVTELSSGVSSGDDEDGRERQEAAAREARDQRTAHQHRAEDGSGLLEELDRGGDGHAAELSHL